jgi:hypothetical protein
VGAGRMARWMLLACTAFGLTAMHTLGHAQMAVDTHAGSHPAEAVVAAAAIGSSTAQPSTMDPCHGCTNLGPVAPGSTGMPVWSVCLAVLSGLAVLVLLAALLVVARWRRHDGPAAGAVPWPAAPRGPPRRRVGLRLAAVSVLRI